MKNSALKLLFALFLLLRFYTTSHAQTVLEGTATTDYLTLESWWVKSLDEQHKLNLFNLNEARYYWDSETTELLAYGVLGYDLIKGFGPAAGFRLFGARAAAVGGLQYTYYRPSFFLTTNLTSELRRDPFLEWYALAQWQRPLTEKIGLFSQLQSSLNFTTDRHDFSFQRLRVGLNLGTWQTGPAYDQSWFGRDWDFDAYPGWFLRLQFD